VEICHTNLYWMEHICCRCHHQYTVRGKLSCSPRREGSGRIQDSMPITYAAVTRDKFLRGTLTNRHFFTNQSCGCKPLRRSRQYLKYSILCNCYLVHVWEIRANCLVEYFQDGVDDDDVITRRWCCNEIVVTTVSTGP
jgi:hypothetical protein